MATVTEAEVQTVADLLKQLHVPPERILLRPPPGEATEKDLLKSQRICELIDGVLVEKTMGFYESRVGLVLATILEAFARKHKLGIVVGEGAFMRVAAEQVRIPDMAFYSWDQFPGTTVGVGGSLDGGSVLPGFTLSVNELFEEASQGS